MPKGLNDPKFENFMRMVAKSRENEANATKERNKPVWPTFIKKDINKDWTFIKYDQQHHEYVFERDENNQKIEMRYIPEIDEVTVTLPREPNSRLLSPTKFVYNTNTKAWESAFPGKDKHYNQEDGEWGYYNIITGEWTYRELKEEDPTKIPENFDKDVFNADEMIRRLEYQDIRTMETFKSLAVDVDKYAMVYNLETGNFEYMIGSNAGRAKFIPSQGVWDIKINKSEGGKGDPTELCFNIFTGQEMELVDKENGIYDIAKTPEEKAAEKAKKEAEERARQEAEKRKRQEAEEKARQKTLEREKQEQEQDIIKEPKAIQGMNEVDFREGMQEPKDDTVVTITGLEGYKKAEKTEEDYHKAEIAREIQDSIFGSQEKQDKQEKQESDINKKSQEGKQDTKKGKDSIPNAPKKPGLFARFAKWLKEFLGLSYEVPQLDEGLAEREERDISRVLNNTPRRIDTERAIRNKVSNQRPQEELTSQEQTKSQEQPKSQEPVKARTKVKPKDQETVVINLKNIYKYESDYADTDRENKPNKSKDVLDNKGKLLPNVIEKIKSSKLKTITIISSALGTAGTAISKTAKKTISEFSDEWKMIMRTIKGYPSRIKEKYEKVKRTIKGYSKRVQRYYGKDINIKLASILMAGAVGFTALTGFQKYHDNMPYLGDGSNNTTFIDSNPTGGLDSIFNEDGTINGDKIGTSKTEKEANKAVNSQEKNQNKENNNQTSNTKPKKEASGSTYIAPDTLTTGSQTTQYIAEEGIRYSATSQGTGVNGTLRQDANIQIFNRAIVQVNEDGSTKTLLTSKEMTWEDFSKEYGVPMEQIQEMLKQPNVKEMIAIQVAGTEHDIRYVYGWTQASNLQGNTQNRTPQRSNLSRVIEMER